MDIPRKIVAEWSADTEVEAEGSGRAGWRAGLGTRAAHATHAARSTALAATATRAATAAAYSLLGLGAPR